jgi:hypothetical protein
MAWTFAIFVCAGAAWVFEAGAFSGWSFALRTSVELALYVIIWVPLLLRAARALLAERAGPAQPA